jgi:probable addiction module antidote protein
MMRLKKFDVVDFLDSDEAMIEYLNVALEENDPKYFAKALGNVARAKGMSSISEATGLGRQALYKALSSEGNPRIDTLFRVLATLNLRLAITR